MRMTSREVSAMCTEYNEWKNLRELKQSSIEYMGVFYTKEYVEANNLSHIAISRDTNYMHISELVEIKMDDEREIFCRRITGSERFGLPINHPKEFVTSIGTFKSFDYGEFGGQLHTPYGRLYGNFSLVVEFDNDIFAILYRPMCVYSAIFKYVARKKHQPEFVIPTKNDLNNSIYELMYSSEINYNKSLELKAYYQTETDLYFLMSGFNKSMLLKAVNHELIVAETFEIGLDFVRNIIIENGFLYIGSDKIVISIDLSTKRITAYSLISDEAEGNIRFVNDQKDKDR